MIASDKSIFRADIHCHSICSDGSDTPLALLEKAAEQKLQGFSITDHDTIAAYTDDFFIRAADLSIRILSGVEISTALDKISVHILGYGFDLKDLSFIQFLQKIQESRNERNRFILAKLASKKMVISEEELSLFAHLEEKKKSVGRPHIAQLMVQKNYVRSTHEAFELYLKDGASCYVSGFRFSPLEAIEQIHNAGGKAVLAHPHFIKGGLILQKLLSCPFDGIECYYGTLHKNQETPWVNIAKKKHWIATGGSDYHGLHKSHVRLGCSWVGLDTFEALLKK